MSCNSFKPIFYYYIFEATFQVQVKGTLSLKSTTVKHISLFALRFNLDSLS